MREFLSLTLFCVYKAVQFGKREATTKEIGDTMKTQWVLIIGGILSVIIAIFAIVNIDKVSVNYIFGEGQWPLVLVILVSAIVGVLISACFAAFKIFELNMKNKQLEKTLRAKEKLLIDLEAQIQQASNTAGIYAEETEL